MRNKILLALVVGILAFTLPVFSQVVDENRVNLRKDRR